MKCQHLICVCKRRIIQTCNFLEGLWNTRKEGTLYCEIRQVDILVLICAVMGHNIFTLYEEMNPKFRTVERRGYEHPIDYPALFILGVAEVSNRVRKIRLTLVLDIVTMKTSLIRELSLSNGGGIKMPRSIIKLAIAGIL